MGVTFNPMTAGEVNFRVNSGPSPCQRSVPETHTYLDIKKEKKNKTAESVSDPMTSLGST